MYNVLLHREEEKPLPKAYSIDVISDKIEKLLIKQTMETTCTAHKRINNILLIAKTKIDMNKKINLRKGEHRDVVGKEVTTSWISKPPLDINMYIYKITRMVFSY